MEGECRDGKGRGRVAGGVEVALIVGKKRVKVFRKVPRLRGACGGGRGPRGSFTGVPVTRARLTRLWGEGQLQDLRRLLEHGETRDQDLVNSELLRIRVKKAMGRSRLGSP